MKQTIEFQVDNLVQSVAKQKSRATASNIIIIHVINLLLIKSADRNILIYNFNMKAQKLNINSENVIFINTSANNIVGELLE